MASTFAESWAGPYQLGECLGRGTFASIYAARDTRGRRAVVKLLRPNYASSRAMRIALVDEGQLLARLEHPRIRPCLHVDTEQPALVLRDVGGVALSEWQHRQGGALAEGVVRELALQLAEVLVHLHRHRTVHLDLTRRNLLVTPTRQLYVIDFGYGWWPERRSRVHRRPNHANQAHVPPEMWWGARLGPWSDMYRLGVVVWELLTGRPAQLAAPRASLGPGVAGGRWLAALTPERGDLSAGMRELVAAATHPDCRRRPTAEQALGLLQAAPR